MVKNIGCIVNIKDIYIGYLANIISLNIILFDYILVL